MWTHDLLKDKMGSRFSRPFLKNISWIREEKWRWKNDLSPIQLINWTSWINYKRRHTSWGPQIMNKGSDTQHRQPLSSLSISNQIISPNSFLFSWESNFKQTESRWSAKAQFLLLLVNVRDITSLSLLHNHLKQRQRSRHVSLLTQYDEMHMDLSLKKILVRSRGEGKWTNKSSWIVVMVDHHTQPVRNTYGPL